ncbi:MAG: ankyrin repeat domain-containing protein, partial [Proteobacteria bacterium]|nr:ankyrin repeat domain-containing protein [Pseudomonadota bacterium]
MNCPQCHADNPSYAWRCQRCGRALASLGKTTRPNPPADVFFLSEDELSSPEPETAGDHRTEAPASDDMLVAGRYQIKRKLGQGDLGTVYLALDRHQQERELVLKFIDSERLAPTEGLRRLNQAVTRWRRIQHPGVAWLYGKGYDGDNYHLAVEYVPGKTLRQVLDARGQRGLRLDDVRRVSVPILDALDAVHRHTAHLSLKPSNVLLGLQDKGLVVKLTDVAVADAINPELRRTLARLGGAERYLAPEQIEGRAEIGPAADLYAWAAMLVEMLHGRIPHPRDGRLSDAVPGLPPALNEVVNRALATDPADRYTGAAELRREFVTALGDKPAAGPPPVPRAEEIRPVEPAPIREIKVVEPLRPAPTPGHRVAPRLRAEDLLRLAEQAMGGHHYGQAVTYYQQALARDPENHAARRGLEKARAAYDSQEAQELFRTRRRSWSRRQKIGLIAALATVLLAAGLLFGLSWHWRGRRHDQWISARLSSARRAVAAKKLDQATTFYQSILRRFPGNTGAKTGLKRIRAAKLSLPTPPEDAAAIIAAARTGHLVRVEAVLQKNPQAVTARGRAGRTALHLAAAGDHHALADYLIKKGASVFVRDKAGLTPLHLAAGQGHPDLVRLLLQRGADPKARDNQGLTPLHWASRQGHHRVARILIDRGVDLRGRDRAGRTPLHLAASQGSLPLVKLLIERGGRYQRTDRQGATPLHYAAGHGRVVVVKHLLTLA